MRGRRERWGDGKKKIRSSCRPKFLGELRSKTSTQKKKGKREKKRFARVFSPHVEERARASLSLSFLRRLHRRHLLIALVAGMENYHVIDLVGEGSFGKVRRRFSFSFIVAPFSVSTGAFFLLPSRSVQALERLSLSSRESTVFVHRIRAQKAVAALETAFEARRQAYFPFSLSYAPMPRHRSSFFSTSSASLLLPSPSSLFFALSTGALPPPQLHPAPSRSTRPAENTRAPSSPSSASPRPASPRGTSQDCAPRSTSCGGCATPGSSRCSTRSRRGTTSAW